MKPSCHICKTPADFLMRKDGFDEYLCPSCRLSFVYPQPEAEWLKDNVYSYESGYQGNKKNDLSISSTDERTTKALDFLSQNKSGGALLDVGCSNGLLMYHARKRGFSCSGVEINKRTADIAAANGFAVHQGFLETAPFKKGSFDVIYLGDVIEHVNSPRTLIETCSSFLKKDGVIAISTPNVDCWWSRTTLALFRICGVPWSSATPPHHLFQFSYGNLTTLMGERGFSPLHSIFTGPSSLKYELGSLHLLGAWKKDKKLSKLAFMWFSFAAYAVIFGLTRLFKPFLKRRFEMVSIYSRV